jgi:hypothetical protein
MDGGILLEKNGTSGLLFLKSDNAAPHPRVP